MSSFVVYGHPLFTFAKIDNTHSPIRTYPASPPCPYATNKTHYLCLYIKQDNNNTTQNTTMQAAPTITRIIAGLIGVLWCYIEPSFNYIAVCFAALLLDCYTAWRCNFE